jgi:hypothetical protein
MKVKKHGRTHTPLANAPITSPAAVITTANDGTWPLTREELNFLIQHQGHPAFSVCTDPALGRPLPTSVVYRVWGMVERGELTLEETP